MNQGVTVSLWKAPSSMGNTNAEPTCKEEAASINGLKRDVAVPARMSVQSLIC